KADAAPRGAERGRTNRTGRGGSPGPVVEGEAGSRPHSGASGRAHGNFATRRSSSGKGARHRKALTIAGDAAQVCSSGGEEACSGSGVVSEGGANLGRVSAAFRRRILNPIPQASTWEVGYHHE